MAEDKAVIFEQLQEIIGNQLGMDTSKIKTTSDFTKELGADSLDVVELVMAFEEKFEVEIEDEVAGDMVTVQDAIDYIYEHQAT